MDFLNKKEKIKLEMLMPLIKERLALGETVKLSPNGTSMLPMLRQGKDSVVLAPVKGNLKKYDLPLYVRQDGQYVLHRIVKAEKGVYTCIGDNQFALEPGVKQEDVIAYVSDFYRGDKKYSVKSFVYKMYVCFWHNSRPLRMLWVNA